MSWFECPICLESHVYGPHLRMIVCHRCIQGWCGQCATQSLQTQGDKQTNRCPFCRQDLKEAYAAFQMELWLDERKMVRTTRGLKHETK
jgi:hypothetical protein